MTSGCCCKNFGYLLLLLSGDDCGCMARVMSNNKDTQLKELFINPTMYILYGFLIGFLAELSIKVNTEGGDIL